MFIKDKFYKFYEGSGPNRRYVRCFVCPNTVFKYETKTNNYYNCFCISCEYSNTINEWRNPEREGQTYIVVKTILL